MVSRNGGPQVIEGRVEEKRECDSARARKAAQYGRWSELESMLESGEIALNDLDDEGCTLLQWAAINNRVKVVSELLARGAHAGASGGILKETALQWAARQGHVEPCVLLREAGCDAGHRGVEGANAVHLACRYGKHVVVAYLLARDEVPPGLPAGLLDLPDDRGRTPLMVCVEWYWHEARGGLDTMRVLIALGCSVNYAERETGRTSLHMAAERNLDRIALEALVEAGASVEAEDSEGMTAEQVAVANGHMQAAIVLRHLRRARSGPCCWRRSSGQNGDRGWRCADGCCRPRSGGPRCLRGASKKEEEDDLESLLGGGASSKQDVAEAAKASSTEFATHSAPVLNVPTRNAPSSTTSAADAATRSQCAAIYGFSAPWFGFAVVVFVAIKSGWLPGLVAAAVAPLVLLPAAPRGAGRYGMCGFAGCSIGIIVASFFANNFGTPMPLVAIYLALAAGIVVNFTAAICADPGIIDPPRSDRILAIVKLARMGKLAHAKLCPTCLIDRPPRSKHDPTLGKCVRRFDHFCPYIANVVGQNNYLYFYLFLLFVVLGIGFHLVLVLPHLQLFSCFEAAGRPLRRRPKVSGDKLYCLVEHNNALLLVGTALACVHIVWVSALCCVHTNFILRDTTTYESMRDTHHLRRRQHIEGTFLESGDGTANGVPKTYCASSIHNVRNSLCAETSPFRVDSPVDTVAPAPAQTSDTGFV